MQIQNIYKCKHYKQNENLNLTCNKKQSRCKVYYDEVCKEYEEKKDENKI